MEMPISIFKNNKLSCLETIVKYMKEDKGLKIIEIANLLNRNNKTVWATYDKAKRKMKGRLDVSSEKIIPASIFRARLLSVLESLVEYLKENQGMKFSKIAIVLNRDNRTIWTVYKRAAKKRQF